MEVKYCNEIHLRSLLTLNQISSLIFFNIYMTGLFYFRIFYFYFPLKSRYNLEDSR